MGNAQLSGTSSTTNTTFSVTADAGSAGQRLRSSTATSALRLSVATPQPAIEYKVGSGPWRVIGSGEGVSEAVNLAATAVLVRKHEGGKRAITLTVSYDSLPSGLTVNGVELVDSSAGPSVVNEYTGQIATRTAMCNTRHASNKQLKHRSGHYFRTAGSTIQVEWPNFIVTTTSSSPTGTGQEVGGAGVMTIAAAYEAADGTIVPLTFNGGASTGDAADGGTVKSDVVAVPPYKAGDKFYLHVDVNTTGKIVYQSIASLSGGVDGVMGDKMRVGVSGVSTGVAGDAFTSNVTANSGIAFLPVAILGPTKRRSVYILCDSRGAGSSDTYDRSGDLGEVARTVGAHLGYVNVSVPSDRAVWWLAYNAQRIKLLDYCTDAIVVLGINDLASGGRTSAQVIADLVSIYAALKARNPNIRVYGGTITPHTSSTDSWATTANQTAQTTNTNRVAVNDSLRSGSMANLHKCIDLADINESYRNSGLYGTVGAANIVTDDGLHLKQYGLKRIEYSAVIRNAVGF